MRKPSPGAAKRLFEGDLNRGEKVAGERGRSVAGAYVIIHNFCSRGSDYYATGYIHLSSITAMENRSDKLTQHC